METTKDKVEEGSASADFWVQKEKKKNDEYTTGI